MGGGDKILNAKTVKRVFIALIILFAVIFVFCFIYQLADKINYNRNYISNYHQPLYYGLSDSLGKEYISMDSYSLSARNYASENQFITDDIGTEINYDQKYEMISNVTAYSENFENDAKILRKTVEDLNGVVQMEYTSGLEEERNRRLWMSIGIPPGRFDLLVDRIKEIGTLTGFSINKVDKTAEFRSYLAQREGLERTLASYISLKFKTDIIADLLQLEEKIIETEKEILEMGVTLGVYDESQSMCTVDFTLVEYAEDYGGAFTVSAVSELIALAAYSAVDAFPVAVGIYGLILLLFVGTGFSALGIAFVLSRITKQNPETEKAAKNERYE